MIVHRFVIWFIAVLPALAQDIVVVCPITGPIEPGVAVVVERAVEHAKEINAKAILFRIDTPGGRVDSAIDIATDIQSAPMTTIAYIEGMGAISAGALISYACNEIVMTPGTNIGAATPVIPSAEGMKPTGEKEVSFMRAKMRALAESRGHNPSIAEAMVDKDIELRGVKDANGKYTVYSVMRGDEYAEDPPATAPAQPENPLEKILKDSGFDVPGVTPPQPAPQAVPAAPAAEPAQAHAPGTVVFDDGSERLLPAGKLLTLTPDEALRYGVIKQTVNTLDEAVALAGITAPAYDVIEPTWSEALFRWLTSPTIAGLLLMAAIGGIYVEIKTPGFGLPGAVGVVCLALLLGSHYVIGLANVLDIVLVVSGVLLVIAEIFVLPGFGVAGAAGILCILAGLYLTLVDFTVPEYSWQFDRLGEVAYSVGLSATLFVLLVIATWRLLPRTSVYHRMVLSDVQLAEEGYTVQSAWEGEDLVGMRGTALSMLRPAGRARFGEKTFQVVTSGDFVPVGTEVEVIRVDGNRVVVGPFQGRPS